MSVFRFWPRVRILSIGDSVSAQGQPNCWQHYLLLKLRQNRGDSHVAWNFVGSQNSVPPIFTDAYPGNRIDQLTPATYFTNNPADVVIVHAGINDAIQDATSATMKTRTITFLDSLFTVAPTAHVVVCRIIPMAPTYISYSSARAAVVADYNNVKLPEVLVNYPQRSLELVDLHTGYVNDGSWHTDGAHPNHLGAKFMADRICGTGFSLRSLSDFSNRDLVNEA